MTRNVFESDFFVIENGHRRPFFEFKKNFAYDVFVYDLACLLNLITVVVGAYIA